MMMKSRRMRWGGHVALLVGKLEAKWKSGSSIRRWEDNITMDHTDKGYNDIGWFHLAQDNVKCLSV